MSRPILWHALRTLGATIILSFGVIAAVSAPQPAFAHDSVVSSSPAENESLASAPEAVTIEFTDELLTGTSARSVIDVKNSLGQLVSVGEATVDGRIASTKLEPNLPNGQYQVTWSVASADGHRIEAMYQFAIGEPVKPLVEPSEEPAAVEPETEQAPEPRVTTAMQAPESAFNWARPIIIALIGAAAGAAVYVVFLLRKRSRAQDSATKEDQQ